jgi:hypothetical protein
LNSSGGIVSWNAGPPWGTVYKLIKTLDGGFAATGVSYPNDAFVVKMNSSGTPQWSAAWDHTCPGGGGSLVNEGYSVVENTDGSIIVGEVVENNNCGGGSVDIHYMKFNSAGTMQGEKRFNTLAPIELLRANNGYVGIGHNYYSDAATPDMEVYGFDNNFNNSCLSSVTVSPTSPGGN